MTTELNQIITSVSGTDFAIVSTITAVVWKCSTWAYKKLRPANPVAPQIASVPPVHYVGHERDYREQKCWVRDSGGKVYQTKMRLFYDGHIVFLSNWLAEFGAKDWYEANPDGTLDCAGHRGGRWWISKEDQP